MSKITRLVFASHNPGKLKEIADMLQPYRVEVLSAAELNLPDVEETGKTFEENARLKAETLSRMSGLVCLADDSGLCVDCLDGRPGVYSARYAPDRDFDKGMDMLLTEIAATGDQARKAHFSCVLALADPNEGKTRIFEGRVDGHIQEKKTGSNGFGYDPIFVPEGYEKSFAELTSGEKAKISHRGRALQKFLQALA